MRKRYVPMNHHVCRVRIWGPEKSFYVYFYGLRAEELMTVPNYYIAMMQKRRGFTADRGYNSSVFFVEHVR